jgi:hypothetical protein
MEQQAVYHRVGASDIAAIRVSQWWLGQPDALGETVADVHLMTAADRAGLSAIPFVKCPTRRTGLAVTKEKIYEDSWNDGYAAAGPVTDYAGIYQSVIGVGYWNGSEGQGDTGPSAHIGPLRGSIFSDSGDAESELAVAKTWKPRDTFSWWSDGASNQLVMGEKHVPAVQLGKCAAYDSDTTVGANHTSTNGECSYLKWGHYSTAAMGRAFSVNWLDSFQPTMSPYNVGPKGRELPLARNPNDYVGISPMFYYGFGSYHPGVCNFLVGDGAVQSISVMIPVTPILIALAMVNDGAATAIP